MKRILFAFFIGIFLSLGTLEAQSQQDVVFKKDGSELRGTIIEQVLGEYLRIRIMGGSIFQIPYKDIERIALEERGPSTELLPTYAMRPSPFSEPYEIKEKGFYHVIEMGFTMGENLWGSNEGNFIGTYAFGYRFHPRLGLGLGIAYERFSNSNTVPLYLDLRGDILVDRRYVPFYFAGIGFGFDTTDGWSDEFYEERYEGGFHGHIGIGLKIRVKKSALLLSVGQEFQDQYQYIRQDDTQWGGNLTITERDLNHRRLWFRLGMEF